MQQPIAQLSRDSLPWLIRRPGRITTGIIAAAVAYLATMTLPDELNLLIPYDIGRFRKVYRHCESARTLRLRSEALPRRAFLPPDLARVAAQRRQQRSRSWWISPRRYCSRSRSSP